MLYMYYISNFSSGSNTTTDLCIHSIHSTVTISYFAYCIRCIYFFLSLLPVLGTCSSFYSLLPVLGTCSSFYSLLPVLGTCRSFSHQQG